MLGNVPGPANTLVVTPEDMQEIENGSPVSFNVVVQDVANNVTSEGKQIITCKVRKTFVVSIVHWFVWYSLDILLGL